MKVATLVLAEHNEGKQINDSLDNLFKHNDSKLFNVIVVSDGSTIEVDLSKYKDKVEYVKSAKRVGVGASFDIGSEFIKTPYMFIMGSDVRFRSNRCVEKMINYLEKKENRKSIITSVNLGINTAANKTIYSEKLMKRYGAKVLFFLTAQDLPPKGVVMGQLKNNGRVPTYRNIIESKWIPKWDDKLYELPCVLGAFYGVHTDWYRHIMGFQGHRYWGTLEPFISLKSWFAGGDCKLAPDIETGHLFKVRSSHVTAGYDLIYNKIIISKILLGQEMSTRFIEFLGINEDIVMARNMYEKNKNLIDRLSKSFKEIKKRNIHWFNERFPFKYYDYVKNIKDEVRNS